MSRRSTSRDGDAVSPGTPRKTVRAEMERVGGGVRGFLLLAIIAVAAGAALWVFQSSSAASGGSGKPVDPSLVTGLSGGAPRSSSASNHPVAGPAMVKIGVSFIAAFAAGFLLRSFVKWGLLLVGVLAIGIYLLQRAGAVNVNWESLESQTGEATSWIKAQTESFSTFIKGVLPSGASAGVGLWAGFRRKLPI